MAMLESLDLDSQDVELIKNLYWDQQASINQTEWHYERVHGGKMRRQTGIFFIHSYNLQHKLNFVFCIFYSINSILYFVTRLIFTVGLYVDDNVSHKTSGWDLSQRSEYQQHELYR